MEYEGTPEELIRADLRDLFEPRRQEQRTGDGARVTHALPDHIREWLFASVDRSDSRDTIEADELARRLDELVVVDARVPSRFRGEPNPVDRVPGRIPGARNAPWNEPRPELPPGELVAYCGSGVTACVVLHRLALSGRDGKLYPGSWSEWENLGLPVEKD